MKNNMKNLIGWVKFNESMDEEKCDCSQEDCGICNPEEKVEEKKNPFAKMNAKKKEDKADKKTAPKKGEKKDGAKKGLSAAQLKLPWNKGKS